MKSKKIDAILIQGYFGLLANLNLEMKLGLIELLSSTIKKEISIKKSPVKISFGAWKSTENARELI